MGQMPTVASLDELTGLARQHPGMFVRWSCGPAADAAGKSLDDLTGEPLPGLSANPLAVEEWWGGRPLRLWIARRLFDYSHLEHDKGPGVRPWMLEGHELGRGPDNEPLVRCDRAVAWIGDRVIREAVRTIEEQNSRWGPLRRPSASGRGKRLLPLPAFARRVACPAFRLRDRPGAAALRQDGRHREREEHR
jgi:hypothetical protein